MHVTWSVQHEPIYELSLTLCREELDRLRDVLIAGDYTWSESAAHQHIIRAITDAIREATNTPKKEQH